MVQTDVVVVLVTHPEEGAEALARALVDRRLAACVQALPGARSVHRWRGEVETAVETRLEIKTGAESLPALLAAVKELHPYEVPEVLVLPVLGGNPDYLAWVRGETVEPS